MFCSLFCVGDLPFIGWAWFREPKLAEEMSSYLMYLLLILLCFMSNGILLEVNRESCTEGFMDYSLLEGKAATPSGPLRNNRLAENTATRWIIIEDSMGNDIMFTCATVITEILIGVDIRTVNDNIGRNLYPKFEVWAPTNNMMTEYTREMSVEIRLTPDNFTTNGQYHFTLPTPLSVSIGYRIGVYQPPDDESVVRFHYMNLPTDIDGTGKIPSNKINDTNIRISGAGRDVDYESWTILIHPIAQNTSCYTQLLPPESILTPYAITNLIFISDTRIFPDIRFTCHGIITNWIVYTFSQYMPVIKIRHSNGITTTAATLNTSASNAVSISQNLHNFTMSNEITVQPGDILMIESDATNIMFYQQYNGPHNYRLGDNNELTALDTNDYPLISVVVETFNTITSLYTATSTFTTNINTLLASSSSYAFYSTAAITTESTERLQTAATSSMSLQMSATTSMSNVPIVTFSTSTSSMMSTPVSTLQSTENNTLIIAGSISTAVFILLVVTILVILIVSVLVCRRRLYQTSNGNDTFSSTERKADINQQSDVPNMKNTLTASTNPPYGVIGENCNTDVSANPAYGVIEKSGISANPAYGITGAIESINEETLV